MYAETGFLKPKLSKYIMSIKTFANILSNLLNELHDMLIQLLSIIKNE